MHNIVDIDQYAKDAFESYMQAYLEIEMFKKSNSQFFAKRDDLFRRECRNYITKVHKFMSHYLMKAQVEINDSVD